MVNSCKQYSDDLSCFLDKQLEAARHDEVSQHLSVCSTCQLEYEQLAAVVRLMDQNLGEMPIPDLWQKVSAELPSVCQVIEEDLSAYLDGELPAAAQEGIVQHLKACSPCCDRFKLLNQTNQLIAQGLELPAAVSVELWPAVKSRLNEDCALIQSELSAFIDQEVAAQRHRSITSHLSDCPSCKSRFDELTQVGDVLRNSYQPVFPADFDLWPGIKSKMQVVPFRTQAPAKSRFSGGHRLYLVGAAAVIVGLLGSLVFLFMGPGGNSNVTPVSAEAYLLDSALNQPSDSAEAIVYGNQ